ncbi:hypothetical protein CEP53_001522 [Fusarium sp. AF-6]|nr:hypothetical protein CEP53_001522 [Fusarium sp. AF-6]
MEAPPGVPTTSSGQRQWATPDMWQSHRRIIAELYQSHTLKEVMRIMTDKHKFFATVRMYKSHISKWGLQKHFRVNQVQALVHQKAERDAVQKASSMYIRGNKVDSKKLQTYINRTSKQNKDRLLTAANGGPLSPSAQGLMAVVACRTPSPTQSLEKRHPTATHRGQRSNNGTCLDTENPFGSRSPWLRTPLPQPRSSFLLLSASDAQARTEKCMKCLRDYVADNFDCGRWSNDLGKRGRMELDQVIDWANLFDDALRFLDRRQTQRGFRLLRICFDQYRALLAAGSVRLFFSIYPILYELRDYPDLAKRMIAYASKMSKAIHSEAHPFTVLWSQLVDFNLAEDLIQKDIATWENYTHPSSRKTMCLKRGLSTLYSIHHRYDDLRRVLTEMGPWPRAPDLDILGAAAADQGDFEQAIELYNAWLSWSLDTLGVGHDETVRASIHIENLLRDIGDMGNANVVSVQSEISLDVLCVRLGELELQEMCDEGGLEDNEVEFTSSSLDELNIGGDSLAYQGGQALGSVGEDAIGSELWISLFENWSAF